MLKKTLTLTALIISLFTAANAQTDTSHYDLGRISVKKDFTQSVTVKGSDLERYQFSDLADAINVWFNGTYSNASTLVYVIDGNIIADVNAYSIYDIDEITLVQNALSQVSGVSPDQQMVLIKLKTNRPGKQGVEAAGQTSVINLRNPANNPISKTTSSFYDQYYVSGYKNFDKVHLGLSADYQRDVFPGLSIQNSSVGTGTPNINTFSSFNPPNSNRFKINGFADATLWKGSTINIGVNYVPQVNSYTADFTSTNAYSPGYIASVNDMGKLSQHLFNTNLALKTSIVKGLSNTLSAAYSH